MIERLRIAQREERDLQKVRRAVFSRDQAEGIEIDRCRRGRREGGKEEERERVFTTPERIPIPHAQLQFMRYEEMREIRSGL